MVSMEMKLDYVVENLIGNWLGDKSDPTNGAKNRRRINFPIESGNSLRVWDMELESDSGLFETTVRQTHVLLVSYPDVIMYNSFIGYSTVVPEFPNSSENGQQNSRALLSP